MVCIFPSQVKDLGVTCLFWVFHGCKIVEALRGFEAPRSFPFHGEKTKAVCKHGSKPTSDTTLYWFLFSRDLYNGFIVISNHINLKDQLV